MQKKKLDLRRVTKKNLEDNIICRTETGKYFADINGVEVLFEYRHHLDDIFCPICDKDNPDCNRIYVYVDYGKYGYSGIFDNLVKIISW